MKSPITKDMISGEIFGSFIRYNGNFSLVAYHMVKDYPRSEALEIKNKYNMKSVSHGYEGMIPKSLFLGGFLITEEVKN
jgi:hypothetical protein